MPHRPGHGRPRSNPETWKAWFPCRESNIGRFPAFDLFLGELVLYYWRRETPTPISFIKCPPKSNFQKSEDHNNRKSLYMKRLYSDFGHEKYGFPAGRAISHFWGFEIPYRFPRKSALCYLTQLSCPTALRARKPNNSIPPIYRKSRISENQLFIFIY